MSDEPTEPAMMVVFDAEVRIHFRERPSDTACHLLKQLGYQQVRSRYYWSWRQRLSTEATHAGVFIMQSLGIAPDDNALRETSWAPSARDFRLLDDVTLQRLIDMSADLIETEHRWRDEQDRLTVPADLVTWRAAYLKRQTWRFKRIVCLARKKADLGVILASWPRKFDWAVAADRAARQIKADARETARQIGDAKRATAMRLRDHRAGQRKIPPRWSSGT